MKQVSEKNTKQEILKAYQEALADKDAQTAGALFTSTEKTAEKEPSRAKGRLPSVADKVASEDLLFFVEQMENDFKVAMQEFLRGVISLRTELEKERVNHEEQTREQRESWRREQESYIYDRDLERKKKKRNMKCVLLKKSASLQKELQAKNVI